VQYSKYYGGGLGFGVTCVKPKPVLVLVEGLLGALDYKVVVFVVVERECEGHVGEDGVIVHPEEPFDVGAREHEHVDREELRPPASHVFVERVHVVVELNAVEAAVVHLDLELRGCVLEHELHLGIDGVEAEREVDETKQLVGSAVEDLKEKAAEVAPEALEAPIAEEEAAEGAPKVKETEGPSAVGEEAAAIVDERDLPVTARVEEAIVELEASSVSGEKVRAAGEEEASDVIDEPSAVVNEKADTPTEEEKSSEVVPDVEESGRDQEPR
jgi:hypothetical protein